MTNPNSNPTLDAYIKSERQGFEPWNHLSAVTRFPVVFFQPLRHLSWMVTFKVTENGERRIRTSEPLRANGFRDRRIRPLCHLSRNKKTVYSISGGGRRIRTPEGLATLMVFKTTAFGRSAIPPGSSIHRRVGERSSDKRPRCDGAHQQDRSSNGPLEQKDLRRRLRK